MKITKAEMKAIAIDLMSGNNLMKRDLIAEGWSFEFSKRKAALGDCNYRTKTLRISEEFLNARTKEEQINTITHEMAHAIAYTDYNARGQAARDAIAEIVMNTTHKGCKSVSFEQRGKYKDWYIIIELEAHTIEKRLDTFKKSHGL